MCKQHGDELPVHMPLTIVSSPIGPDGMAAKQAAKSSSNPYGKMYAHQPIDGIEDSLLHKDTVVMHKRKRDIYKVLATGKMELDGGIWVQSVSFIKQTTGEVFTRPYEKFIHKFTLVK